MMKKLLGFMTVITLFCNTVALMGCSDSGTTESIKQDQGAVTETTEEKTTTKATTEATTQATTKATTKLKTNQDIKHEIEEGNSGNRCAVVNDEEIVIYEYAENMSSFLYRCSADGDFSADSYEMWLDMKDAYKEYTRLASIQYDRSVTLYILDDTKHSSAVIPDGGEFYYLAEFSNGYCTFDISD